MSPRVLLARFGALRNRLAALAKSLVASAQRVGRPLRILVPLLALVLIGALTLGAGGAIAFLHPVARVATTPAATSSQDITLTPTTAPTATPAPGDTPAPSGVGSNQYLGVRVDRSSCGPDGGSPPYPYIWLTNLYSKNGDQSSLHNFRAWIGSQRKHATNYTDLAPGETEPFELAPSLVMSDVGPVITTITTEWRYDVTYPNPGSWEATVDPCSMTPSGPGPASSATVTFSRAGTVLYINGWVTVATDGSGEVAGQPFQTSVTAGASDNQGLPSIGAVCAGSGTAYACTVPPDCTTQMSWDTLHGWTKNTLWKKFTNTRPAGYTGSWNETYSFDDKSIVCIPGVGYSEPGSFMYALSESASLSALTYRPQDVIDYQTAHLNASVVPANYEMSTAPKICTLSDFVNNNHSNDTPTSTQVPCGAYVGISWHWTPDALQSLAQQLAGKDTAAAQSIMLAQPGVSPYFIIRFNLVGGDKLPTDPSKITFDMQTNYWGELHV